MEVISWIVRSASALYKRAGRFARGAAQLLKRPKHNLGGRTEPLTPTSTIINM